MVANSGTRTRFEPAERLALIGLVGLHVAFAALLFDPEPTIGGDNAHYMILAESIGSGQGYRDIHVPGAPNHAQYPPFYPLVLAATAALGGELVAFKLLSVLFTTASVVALYLLARARLGWAGAVAVAVPLAASPVLLDFSHWVLSEALFVFCVLVALAASERSPATDRWFAVSLAAAVLAFLTRFAGLPLLVALALPLAWRRDWGRLALVGGAATVAVGGWWLWGWLSEAPGANRYAEVVFLRNTALRSSPKSSGRKADARSTSATPPATASNSHRRRCGAVAGRFRAASLRAARRGRALRTTTCGPPGPPQCSGGRRRTGPPAPP